MDTMNTTESVAARLAMIIMMEQIAELPKDEADQFVRVILMVGSCFLNEKNHGVFLLVENEDTLKIMGVNSSLHETGHIVTQAAEVVITNMHANELHRKGETH
jgi:H+/gluconate symporter-like permease